MVGDISKGQMMSTDDVSGGEVSIFSCTAFGTRRFQAERERAR